VYGSTIVGAKLLITGQDRKALDCFFDNKVFSQNSTTYFDLAAKWKSTSELSKELEESPKRTKSRLQKLHALGLVDVQEIKVNKRTDYYWYISQTGLYYILSKLTRPKMIRFLESNKDKLREFGFIKELVAQNKPDASYLQSNLKNFVKNRQYNQMLPFVHDLVKRVFKNQAYYLSPYHPDFKNTIRKKYGTKTIKELEKTYGRILDAKKPNSP